MNTTPKKYGKPIPWEPGCGRVMIRNTELAFWQSRMTVAGKPALPPDLIDVRLLARVVRATYPMEVCHVP